MKIRKRIDSAGRVTLAKEIREILDLDIGDYVDFELQGESIIITKHKLTINNKTLSYDLKKGIMFTRPRITVNNKTLSYSHRNKGIIIPKPKIELIGKEIPLKPTRIKDCLICARCGQPIISLLANKYNTPKYCTECGQAIYREQ